MSRRYFLNPFEECNLPEILSIQYVCASTNHQVVSNILAGQAAALFTVVALSVPLLL